MLPWRREGGREGRREGGREEGMDGRVRLGAIYEKQEGKGGGKE